MTRSPTCCGHFAPLPAPRPSARSTTTSPLPTWAPATGDWHEPMARRHSTSATRRLEASAITCDAAHNDAGSRADVGGEHHLAVPLYAPDPRAAIPTGG